MKKSWILGLCALFATGCIHPRHPHGMPPGQMKQSHHVHGGQCGHHFANGVWITFSTPPGHGSKKGRGRKH